MNRLVYVTLSVRVVVLRLDDAGDRDGATLAADNVAYKVRLALVEAGVDAGVEVVGIDDSGDVDGSPQ